MKDTFVQIRMTGEMHQRLKIVAAHSGRTMQDIMREAIDLNVQLLEGDLRKALAAQLEGGGGAQS